MTSSLGNSVFSTPSLGYGLDLLTLTVLICALTVIYYVLQLQLQRQELRSLKLAVRHLLRNEPLPPGLHLKSTAVVDIWRLVLSLALRGRDLERKESEVQEVIEVTSSITSASHERASTAEEVLKVIVERAGRDVLAAAVILDDEETSEPQLASLHGLPESTMREPLFTAYENLRDRSDEGEEPWGYQLPESSPLFHFAGLGIRLSLIVPLKNTNTHRGALWLGFRESVGKLHPRRRAFLQALSTHAAASFYAAEKSRAREQESVDTKDMLLGMSHDMRAPGNSALYAVRDLLSGEVGGLSPEQHVRLTVVESALEDQLQILSDVLDFAKHQKGLLEARPLTTDLRDVIQKALATFSVFAEQKGISLIVGEIPDVKLFADPSHVQRILSNLLSNALKYTDTGSVTIECGVTHTQEIELSVTDTGIGIPESERGTIFTEFARCSNSAARQGTGLGLALTSALAKLNEGSVAYEPTREGGSRFAVLLPSSEEVGSAESKPLFQTVLVVDDDPAAVRSNIRLLRAVAERMIPAASFAEALELAAQLRPDMVVTDYRLDGTHTGVELLEAFKERDILTKALIVTGSTETPELQVLRLRYGVAILEKPVSREDILLALRGSAPSEHAA